ncbi:hypothetical protein GCM10011376_24150 [Nocardioides flavus (ex Wang et al. 2016)]|uniref:Uncharacterized protein n=1 Tax=Nocardioides flavus (ex Wang et al. 2016) TaxID=2058780 RepID=A0ABQ3HPM6_9ACTN|nr:hypothetical protein [Nocardioides flavus (ex Wang et al. 2016)]GHE17805.1 hypothetical protein GCM10011376_24150 [Nocardioides flavus (ex Wang et al. 2016)]
MSAAGEVGRALGAAIGAVVVGTTVWLVAVLIGVSADVIGVVFHRPEDYPFSGAWMIGSALLGAVAAGAVLWRAGLMRQADPAES